MNIQTVENKLNKLPEKLQDEALDFIEFLLKKNQKAKNTDEGETFTFHWEGGLSEMKSNYTSVDLQHKSSEWR